MKKVILKEQISKEICNAAALGAYNAAIANGGGNSANDTSDSPLKGLTERAIQSAFNKSMLDTEYNEHRRAALRIAELMGDQKKTADIKALLKLEEKLHTILTPKERKDWDKGDKAIRETWNKFYKEAPKVIDIKKLEKKSENYVNKKSIYRQQ